ncbi:CrcB-like protein-domain-containing protein [Dichomitus squalens]|uniref:CrcB-like protein-domain-containing protein n=1 Tax=Dichomitus squalens TaxID=114155 RepID=A0A4Q9NTP5_9APHY|nr:CrcB-like protein-domain-containing protein [Dichomitus squalens]TBU63948.1 CrcB-like protein-domain-containing protein [Dichomitus squalens]
MSRAVNVPLASDNREEPFAEARNAEDGQAQSRQASTVEKVLSSGEPSQDNDSPPPRRSDVGNVLARHSSVRDADSLASIDRPPSEEENLPPSKIYEPLSFPVLALLMPASIFGVLARLGLQAITAYDGKEIFPLAWVQGAGCLVMGFALGLKEPIGQFYGPLYTAITTGFCGSLTTFSGWQVDIFESWINGTASHRDWLRDAIDGAGKTVFTFAISLSAISFGAHLSKLLLPYVRTARTPSRPVRYTLSALAVLVYAAAYPAYFRMSPRFRHEATAALLFSFPGTLSRYLLSLSLNPRLKLFPLGTFAANMVGTALLGTFQVLRSIRHPGPLSANACNVLQGLADGYCGCLTTVSTFAAEVDALPPRRAWLYAVLSWLTGQVLLAIILGPSIGVGHVSREITCRF